LSTPSDTPIRFLVSSYPLVTVMPPGNLHASHSADISRDFTIML
jgi:hypothetical protein